MQSSQRCYGEYNSLNDPHLRDHFTNKYLCKYLKKVGLITKKGEILPEAIYNTNVINAERRREAKEALTQAMLSKSLNLQRQYESEIQNRLDEITKLELIRKIRSEKL